MMTEQSVSHVITCLKYGVSNITM